MTIATVSYSAGRNEAVVRPAAYRPRSSPDRGFALAAGFPRIDEDPRPQTRFADLDLGLADCALIVLAQRHRTTRILHRRAADPLDGGAFTLLPADA